MHKVSAIPLAAVSLDIAGPAVFNSIPSAPSPDQETHGNWIIRSGSPAISPSPVGESIPLGLIAPLANGTFEERFYDKNLLIAYVDQFRATMHDGVPFQLSDSIQHVSACFPGRLSSEIRCFIGKSNSDILTYLTTRIDSAETRDTKTKLIRTLATLMILPDILSDSKKIQFMQSACRWGVLGGILLTVVGLGVAGASIRRHDHVGHYFRRVMFPILSMGVQAFSLSVYYRVEVLPVLREQFEEKYRDHLPVEEPQLP